MSKCIVYGCDKEGVSHRDGRDFCGEHFLWKHLPVRTLPGVTVSSVGNNTPSGVKADASKPRWSLVPWAAMSKVRDVLEFGARKYSPDNWRKVPNARERYKESLLRHILAYQAGEETDSESGLPHLAHAACCVLFLLELPND